MASKLSWLWLTTAFGALALGCLPEPKARDGGTAASASTSAAASTPSANTPVDVGSASAVAAAKEIFANRCTPCHGSSGGGDGPASAGLTPKPRNFTDAAWQKSVTDEHIETIIQYGGAAVGRSPMMPANPDLTSKPDVVSELRKLIRTFAK